MDNNKLYGRHDAQADKYIMPKDAPTEHELITADIEKAAAIASGKPAGVTFIHEGNGAKFKICPDCKESHIEEAHELYKDAVRKPKGIGKQATIIQNTTQNEKDIF